MYSHRYVGIRNIICIVHGSKLPYKYSSNTHDKHDKLVVFKYESNKVSWNMEGGACEELLMHIRAPLSRKYHISQYLTIRKT